MAKFKVGDRVRLMLTERTGKVVGMPQPHGMLVDVKWDQDGRTTGELADFLERVKR